MEVPGRNQTGSEDLETSVECDPCLYDGKTVTAECFCTDCNEFLCCNCAEAHRKSKASRNHELLNSDKVPFKKMTAADEKFCSKHDGELIKYFCKTHDKLCCSVCATLGHKWCEVFYIDDIAGEFKTSTEYQDLLKQIKLLQTKLTETKKHTEKNCENVKQCFTTLISDIQHFRHEIHAKLEELEETLKEKAQTIKTNDIKAMESISTKSESIQKYLREISATLETLEKCKQNQQLFITAKRSLKQVEDRNKQIDDISLENKIEKYSFSWNKEILQSLDVCCKLVHFNVKESEKSNLQEEKQSQGKEDEICKHRSRLKLKFVKEIKIEHNEDMYSGSITGSALLTFDTLALVDKKNCAVKVVELHTDTITSCLKLPEPPQDLACIDSNKLVVTSGTKLTFLKFDGKLSILKHMKMKDDCWGITSHQNKLFVTFPWKPSVEILDSRGAVYHKFQPSGMEHPQHITVSTDGQTIYISDGPNNKVESYSTAGEHLNSYWLEGLDYPTGLTVIENNVIAVCGNLSFDIRYISSLCEHIQPDFPYPRTVLYNRTNNMIYISTAFAVDDHLPLSSLVSVFKLEKQ